MCPSPVRPWSPEQTQEVPDDSRYLSTASPRLAVGLWFQAPLQIAPGLHTDAWGL